MSGKLGKKHSFVSPLHLFWGALFVLVFIKMIPALSGSSVSSFAGAQLLALTPAKSGIPNAVSAVVVFFRGLDTLGEVSVLFLVSSSLGMILGRGNLGHRAESRPNEIVSHSKTLVLPHFLLTGLYITIHGHLTPGGGFQGGVMAAGVALLLILAGDRIKQNRALHFLEGAAGSFYVLIGVSGIWLTGSFLGNFIPLKTEAFGTLFSGGIIPVLYIFIGLKVGTEIIGIYQNFQRKED
jgi:multicomponent Na+:H+ antiporter subunit B